MPALAENPFVRFLFLGFRAISKPSFLKKYSGLTKTSMALPRLSSKRTIL
ncbi:AzlC family protein [Neisseria meningitidis]|nr:AzlC family protein [Neisseria meningitidis]